jgi:hypothetical protein
VEQFKAVMAAALEIRDQLPPEDRRPVPLRYASATIRDAT